MNEIKLENCPYCGHSAEVWIGSEMSDASKIHKVRCSYLHCLTIEKALSGYSPSYKNDLNKLKEDWNICVAAILGRE